MPRYTWLNSSCTLLCPTVAPTMVPTAVPTMSPTVVPTVLPTMLPTVVPTIIPTISPTGLPTIIPTMSPTVVPTIIPTMLPTIVPTVVTGSITIAGTTIDHSIDISNGLLNVIGSLTLTSNHNFTVGSNSINVTDTIILARTLIIHEDIPEYPATIPIIHASTIEGSFEDIQVDSKDIESCEHILYDIMISESVFSVVLSLDQTNCRTGVIIGSSIGGIIGCIAIVTIIVYLTKKQRTKYTVEATERVKERSEQELRDLKNNLAKQYK